MVFCDMFDAVMGLFGGGKSRAKQREGAAEAAKGQPAGEVRESGESSEGAGAERVDENEGADMDRVIIIGAGATGLAIAQGLKKANVPVTIYEKHPSLTHHPRDWNMGLHWGMPHLQSLLPDSIISLLQTTQVDPHTPTKPLDTLTFLNAETGTPLTAMNIPYFYRLRRRALRTLLATDIPIHFSHQLSHISHSPDRSFSTAHFTNGTSASARLIIGADGPRSTVRSLLLGAEKASLNHLPITATFAQASFPAPIALKLREAHPLYLAGVHPGGYFSFLGAQHIADPEDPSSWLFFFYISRPTLPTTNLHVDAPAPTDPKILASEAQKLAGEAPFAEPWRTAFANLPEDARVWAVGMAEWDPGAEGHTWDSGGRVTLAGDAAHVMTYQRGQGLNHSMADAAGLVGAIVKGWGERAGEGLGKEVGVWEGEMRARAGEEVRLSIANTHMLHDWEKAMESPVFKIGMVKSQT
ncbi:FAD/NAD(P)-binding domain-containing protein [Trichodelitschia bisporula]|uniref:FAD/NAD(P)-binding domain-containing protein n=1 Tax=Trichodelitschia bisporula TaxID=703511 RepID=A0A6G1HWZ4_9PEZI|nr:FAD/NAD(P)-binding domain-containing protein [Trichodelitschia bisporula]